jgi:hypothetical protein
MIEAQIDQLAERMNRFKSGMAAVKLELIQSGKVYLRVVATK